MTNNIYKICTQSAWDEAVRQNQFAGSTDDLRDGFIHFSTAAQVTETLRRHFREYSNLLIVAVNAASLGDKLKWEPSRGGQLFPHLYGTLPVQSAICVAPLQLSDKGDVLLPDRL